VREPRAAGRDHVAGDTMGQEDEDLAMAGNQDHPAANRIGLIGGLAVRAGVFYYEQILQRYNARAQPLRLMLNHADVGKVLACIGAGDRAGLGTYLGTLANELFDAGADRVAVTAVAPHLAVREISEVARGPIVNVLDVIMAGLEHARLTRVAVFGNRAVMETNIFGAIPAAMAVPMKPALIETVHATYNDIALHGKRGTQSETALLDRLARELMEEHGAQAIILAGTDLSSFYAGQAPGYPCLDVAQLHIDQIAGPLQEAAS
jgi:aspartate racemase